MKNNAKRAEILPIRFMAFDIETSSLDASYGRVLCACAKFGDRKQPDEVRAPKLKDEFAALEVIHRWFSACDIVVTWYGKMFDIPFVNSRRLHYGLAPLPQVIHKDLCFTSKSKLKFRGNRLDGVSKDLRAKYAKHDLTAATWVAAVDGDAKSLDDIVKHCRFDVLLTEEMLGIMKPLILNFTR